MNNLELSYSSSENLAYALNDICDKGVLTASALSNAEPYILDEFAKRYYAKCLADKNIPIEKIQSLFGEGDLLINIEFEKLVNDTRALVSIYNNTHIDKPLSGIALYGSALSSGKNFRLKDMVFPFRMFGSPYSSDFDMVCVFEDEGFPEKLVLKRNLFSILKNYSMGFNVMGSGNIDISGMYTIDYFLELLNLSERNEVNDVDMIILDQTALLWGWNPDRIYYVSALGLNDELVMNSHIQEALCSQESMNKRRKLLESSFLKY